MPQLTANPAGLELEDFVAAHLAARGAFVERGVTDRDPQDLLELDVVWTDYREPTASRRPIEIKSGQWGLGELFKFYGWIRYLDLPAGLFVCRQLPGRVEPDALERLTARLGVRLLHIQDPENCDNEFNGLGLAQPPAPYLPGLWRYSFWVQRRLIKSLSLCIDHGVCRTSAIAAKDYFKLINDAVFFEPDVRERVNLLLNAHREHPRLGHSVAAELAGLPADLVDAPTTDVFKNALFWGRHPPVQASLLLAHRARLSILKAAVDYILLSRTGRLKPEIETVFGPRIDMGVGGVYASFVRAVERYRDAATVHLYPVLWQSFMWIWGGFFLLSKYDEEAAALSRETGVPEGEVENALSMFDALFPFAGGWFNQPTGASRRVLKLMPPAIRGIGAYGRLLRYGLEEYAQFGHQDRTDRHLASDHNAGSRLLDCLAEDLIQ